MKRTKKDQHTKVIVFDDDVEQLCCTIVWKMTLVGIYFLVRFFFVERNRHRCLKSMTTLLWATRTSSISPRIAHHIIYHPCLSEASTTINIMFSTRIYLFIYLNYHINEKHNEN